MATQKREHGSGTSTEMVYIVEARSTYHSPGVFNGMTLDNRWRKVEFQPSPLGVNNDAFSAEAIHYDRFLGYKAALALAHWFMANAERGYCVETRLVKVKLVSSHSTEEIGVGAAMALFGAEREAVFTERHESPRADDAVDPVGERVTS